MRVQVYSRWSINRLNLRERERNRERGMIEARRSRKRATWPIPPGAEWMEGEGWKERVERRGVASRPGTRANTQVRGGRLEGGWKGVALTSGWRNAATSPPPRRASSSPYDWHWHWPSIDPCPRTRWVARGSLEGHPFACRLQAGFEIDRRSSEWFTSPLSR